MKIDPAELDKGLTFRAHCMTKEDDPEWTCLHWNTLHHQPPLESVSYCTSADLNCYNIIQGESTQKRTNYRLSRSKSNTSNCNQNQIGRLCNERTSHTIYFLQRAPQNEWATVFSTKLSFQVIFSCGPSRSSCSNPV